MKKAVEPCLICNNLPCTCSGSGARKKQLKPQQKPRSDEPKKSRFQAGAPTAYVASPPVEPPRRAPRLTGDATEHHVKTEDELEFEACVQNLSGLLDSAELARYSHILQPSVPSHLERKILEWRERNGLA